jgi:uncharacterized protein YecE (DUF72 family)
MPHLGAMQSAVKVGCCGFPIARGRYAQFFPVVEVQETFYQPPELKTLERWRAEVPLEFEFTLKAWQVITHPPTSPTYRRLREKFSEKEKDLCGNFQWTEVTERAWQRTAASASALRARIVLLQCPASFKPTIENKDNLWRFLRRINRHGFLLAWEPRGQWSEDEIAKLCRECDLIHAVDPFQAAPVTPGLRYFRLHGRTGYRYRFTESDLADLAARCQTEDPTYVLFNNVSMLDDAQSFLARVSRRP